MRGREDCGDLYSKSRGFLRKEAREVEDWEWERRRNALGVGLALRTCVDRQVYSRALRSEFCQLDTILIDLRKNSQSMHCLVQMDL